MTSACADCRRTSVFKVEADGETLHLCSACLDKRFPALRLGLLTQHLIPERTRTVKCPNCGWTEAKAIETSLVGCPLCYEALSPEIWPNFGVERREPSKAS